MKHTMPAVLFAGGKSTRMQTDKALLPFGGFDTLAAFQYHKLSALFEKVYLSAKSDKFPFACALIQDTQPQSSPLVGLISVFKSLDVEEVFILSVDAPFVDGTVVDKILQYSHMASDAIIAQSVSGIQPLCGLYKRSILPLAQAQLAQQNHKLHDLLSHAHTHFVSFDDDKAFSNLNYPNEYQEALSRL